MGHGHIRFKILGGGGLLQHGLAKIEGKFTVQRLAKCMDKAVLAQGGGGYCCSGKGVALAEEGGGCSHSSKPKFSPKHRNRGKWV